ncbi:methyltransferase domain-containing protein [Candidatus Kaiserbacteria bacterium]|nr:methyltransferase domain-containing protein [Candidatus Kaiserbacteria bacterium]
MVVIPTKTRFVHPDIICSHFHLREGDIVADLGAGVGFFTPALSRAVGASGRVYACEIQKNLLERLGVEARDHRLPNVELLWCDLEKEGGTELADGIIDTGVMINTFFQLEDKKTAIKEMARIIRKGGKLFLVDWSESFDGLGPRSDLVVQESEARRLFEEGGFRFKRNFPAGEHHYGLAFWRD